MSGPRNCVQYEGAEPIPCEDISFDDFDDPQKFDSVEFQEFMNRNFSSPEYERDSVSPDGRFKLRQQQKFMGKYFNMHNNFQGCLVYHGLGSGKCHGYGTKIAKPDGTAVEVQDVKVGDKLAGPDGPVTVTNLGTGEGLLYNIVADDGTEFTCNGEHILCLVSTNYIMPPVEITVERLLRIPGIFRGHFRLFRAKIKPWKGPVDQTMSTDNYEKLVRDAGLAGMRMFTTRRVKNEWTGSVSRCKGLSFKITRLQKSRYYGFTLNPESKGRYLLESGIVTHNTCTSVVVGEAYHAFMGNRDSRNKQVIVSLPPSVISQFKEELKGKLAKVEGRNEVHGCSSEIILNDQGLKPQYILAQNTPAAPAVVPESLGGRRRRNNRLKGATAQIGQQKVSKNIEINDDMRIAKKWSVITHIGLINALVKYNDREVMMPLTKRLQKGGNMVIIDEIQNLVSETGVLYRKLLFAMRVIGRNNRVMVMSATPIYDKPFELGLTLNLLNPRVFFPITKNEFDSVFTDGESRMLYDMCKGYVSYFSGGDPMHFPYVRHKYVNVKMGEEQTNIYFDKLKEEMAQAPGSGYDPGLLENDANNGRLVKSRQMCNITYPLDTDSESDAARGLSMIMSSVDFSQNQYESLLEFCPKLLKVCQTIDQNDVSHVVFSDLKRYGTTVIAEILKHMGYIHLTTTDIINTRTYQDIKRRTVDQGRKAFAIWSGDITPNEKNAFSSRVREIMGLEENQDGSLLRCVIGTTSIMEGVSFKGVRGMHIVNPWWNDSRIRQVIARAVRFKSHSKIADPSQHLVTVYKYVSVYPDYPKVSTNIMRQASTAPDKPKISNDVNTARSIEVQRAGLDVISVDQYMYVTTRRKKITSSKFEMTLKRSAVDCNKNRGANKIRLEEHMIPKYGIPVGSSEPAIMGYFIVYLDASKMIEYMDPDNMEIGPGEGTGVGPFVPGGPDIDQARMPGGPDVVLYRAKRYRGSYEDGAINRIGLEWYQPAGEPALTVPSSMIIREDIDCAPPPPEDEDLIDRERLKAIKKMKAVSRNYKQIANTVADTVYRSADDTDHNRNDVEKIMRRIIPKLPPKKITELMKWCTKSEELHKLENSRMSMVMRLVADVTEENVDLIMNYASGVEDVPADADRKLMKMIDDAKSVLEMSASMTVGMMDLME